MPVDVVFHQENDATNDNAGKNFYGPVFNDFRFLCFRTLLVFKQYLPEVCALDIFELVRCVS